MNNGKYCPEIVEEICGHLREGFTAKDCCTLVGITEETYYNWKKEHFEFSESIKKNELFLKGHMMKTVQKAADKHWQAGSWWLERRHDKEFALKNKVEHTGDLSVTLTTPRPTNGQKD